MRPAITLTLAFGLVLAIPSRPDAHEIPASATVMAYVKPEQGRLRLLVRVPLASMRDVQFPTRALGYLDLEATQPLVPDLARMWIAEYVELFEGDTKLRNGTIVATRVSLPADRSFVGYDAAFRNITGLPLPAETDLVLEQAMLDVLIEYPIRSPESRFSINPQWAHLGVKTATVLRYLPSGGSERAYRYDGNPGLVRLDPSWHQAAWTFVKLGFVHILDGLDHLLFVICLVIPFRKIRPLVAIVTSFTVAHSITLIASALGLAPQALWFPPLIEVLIALSIVYMAFENIVGPRLERRWLVAFGFGLVHGFGFSFALRDSLQFAGSHLATSLLAFNVGVELGQVFVLLLAIPVLEWLFRHAVAERMGTIILSALVAHTAWHWMGARWTELRQYEIQRPVFDAALAASAMRAGMLILILIGALWLMYGLFTRVVHPRRERGSAGVELQ